MKLKVKLVNGEEREIEIKDFLSGMERNEILDQSIEYNLEGRELKAKMRAGKLMNGVVKKVIKDNIDVNMLTTESFDLIFSKFAHYFGLEEEKKSSLENKKSTEQ